MYDTISMFMEILFSVPQGSILGPYLFIIYTNCVQESIKRLGAIAVIYVDDTNIIVKARTLEELQTKTLNILTVFLKKNCFIESSFELGQDCLHVI